MKSVMSILYGDAVVRMLVKVRAAISVATIAKVELQSAATSMVIVDVYKVCSPLPYCILI
jgi:hypothetical protein